MKHLIIAVIIGIGIALFTAGTVYGSCEGQTFWLDWEAIQAIHDCDSCSEFIDWETVKFDH